MIKPARKITRSKSSALGISIAAGMFAQVEVRWGERLAKPLTTSGTKHLLILTFTKTRQRWWVGWIWEFWRQPLLNITLWKWNCSVHYAGSTERGLTVWALQAWCDHENEFSVRPVKVSTGRLNFTILCEPLSPRFCGWLKKKKKTSLDLFNQASMTQVWVML